MLLLLLIIKMKCLKKINKITNTYTIVTILRLYILDELKDI